MTTRSLSFIYLPTLKKVQFNNPYCVLGVNSQAKNKFLNFDEKSHKLQLLSPIISYKHVPQTFLYWCTKLQIFPIHSFYVKAERKPRAENDRSRIIRKSFPDGPLHLHTVGKRKPSRSLCLKEKFASTVVPIEQWITFRSAFYNTSRMILRILELPTSCASKLQ